MNAIHPLFQKRLRRGLAVAALALLTGCWSEQERFQKSIPADEDRFARSYIELLRHRKFQTAFAMLDPRLKTAGTVRTLVQMSAVLQKADPHAIETVDIERADKYNPLGVQMTYQLRFPAGWALATIGVWNHDNRFAVVSVNMTPLPWSLRAMNRFNLRRKSLNHYSVLILAGAVVVVTVRAFLLCLGMKLRHRWAWLLISLVGFCKLSFNWSTGQFALHPWWVGVGAIAHRSTPYAPWVITFTIPFGALLFFAMRSRELNRKPAPPERTTPIAP